MIDFDRFWSKGQGPYGDEDGSPGGADATPPPGVTPEAIRGWERRHGVTLPEPIRTALGRRNGGWVRNTEIEILPLEQIEPVDDEFWDYTEIEEDEAPDHRLLFAFGGSGTGGTYLLNFNANGAGGPPSVSIDYHGESTHFVSDTIGAFFDEALASSPEPSVDWSEAEGRLPVVARETIDLSAMYDGRPASEDQILARDGEALVLFTRQRSPDGETLTRTTLPPPLVAGVAEVRPYRPAPLATFALHLQPCESEGIVEERSETNDDGRWKNSTAHGVPVYVTFESTDRARLQALRAQLVGTEAAARAQARQDRQAELQETLDGLPPEQRTAALLQSALAMKAETDRRFAARFGDLGPVPPELAGAAEAMRRKLEEMAARVRQKVAANPPDPETLRRIQGLLRDQDAG